MTFRLAVPVAVQSTLFITGGLALAMLSSDPMWAFAVVGLAAGAVLLATASVPRRAAVVAAVILALALLAPRLRGGESGGAPVRAEDLLVAATALVLALGTFRANLRIPVVVATSLAGCAFLALIGSSLTTDAVTSWSDLMFFVRLVKYLVVFGVGYALARHFDSMSPRFVAAILGIFGLLAAIGVAQYFDLFSINARLSPRYDDATLLQDGASWRRAFGTVGNSNYFGFLCAVGATIAAWSALTIRRVLVIATAAGVGSLCLLGVLASGSRGASLALGAMLTVVVLTGIAGARQRRRLLVGGLILAAAGPALANFLGTMPFASRFFFVWGVQDSNSLVSVGLRRQLWEAEIERLNGHWLFGLGPQKGQLVQWVDNDFLRITREFGIVTSIPYLVALSVGALLLLRGALRNDDEGGRSRLALALVAGIAAMGVSADVFYHEQSMAVVLVVLGLFVPRRIQ